jgi:hypothetical protein
MLERVSIDMHFRRDVLMVRPAFAECIKFFLRMDDARFLALLMRPHREFFVWHEPLHKKTGAARRTEHDGPLFNQPAMRQASSL